MNAGMLLIKCSEWSKTFMLNVYNARSFDKARALDQSSIQSHVDALSEEEFAAHIKVVPKYAMNVYLEEYRPGDFLLHMAGKLYEATEDGLWAIANQFDILSTAEDIDDVRAFFEHRHLLNYYSGTCPVPPGVRQSECKPTDPRRITLNESLGAMSSPNRYRHVGLRYYWLGHWTDKYDVPGWNEKRKSLPLPVDRVRAAEEQSRLQRAKDRRVRSGQLSDANVMNDEHPDAEQADVMNDDGRGSGGSQVSGEREQLANKADDNASGAASGNGAPASGKPTSTRTYFWAYGAVAVAAICGASVVHSGRRRRRSLKEQ